MTDNHAIAENSDNESDSYRSTHTEESWHCGCCYDPYPIDIFMERHHNFINEYETRKGRGAMSHACAKKGNKHSEKKIKKLKRDKIDHVQNDFEEYNAIDIYSEMNTPPGDFSFIAEQSVRIMFEDAYKAITKADAWGFVGGDPGEGGFMFSKDPVNLIIQNHMEYDGHSGASYGWTMRKMQQLSRIGWEAFVKENAGLTL